MGCILHFRGERIPLVATLAQVSPISSRTLRLGIKFQPAADSAAALEKQGQVQKVIDELQRQRSVRQQVRRAS
jgi:hypothetical protein